MPNARPWRTRRSSSSAASWASLSSSTKNSWNSSTMSRMRGHGRLVRVGVAVAGEVVARRRRGTCRRARFSSPSSRCSTLRPNSRSLSMATTRACGSRCVGVGLELDALLEVDQVQLDLVRAVVQREVGDEGVQQRRLAGAGLAGDEDVLGGALAEAQAPGGVVAPARPIGTSSPPAAVGVQTSLVVRARCSRTAPRPGPRRWPRSPTICTSSRRSGRRSAAASSASGNVAEVRVRPVEACRPSRPGRRRLLQVGQVEVARHRLAAVSTLTSVQTPQRGAAGDDADEPPGRLGGEVGREVGDDQDAERLGHLAGSRVVLLDRSDTGCAGTSGSRSPCGRSGRPAAARCGAARSRCGWRRAVSS